MANYQTINVLRNSIIENGNIIDFADRIPEATQENLREVGQALFSYKPALNEFLNTLFNKIGLTYVKEAMYSNQLAVLKRGFLEWGDTIEEVFVDICKAHTYSVTPATGEESDVWKVEKPEVLSAFHKINRQDFYKQTITEKELQKAFTSYTAFTRFIAGIFSAMQTSDNVDEYIIFKQLLGDCLDNAHKMVVVKPTDKATSEAFSIALRQAGLSLTYPTRDYNQAGVMNVTPIDRQIIFLHKDVVPVIDVTQLANNFNINLGKPLSNRMIIVDDFGDNHDTILGGITDDEFSMIYDVLLTTESIYNPQHRYWNHFLHHHQVIASSPFSNAICFATSDGTFKINTVNVIPESQTVRKGFETDVKVEMDYDGTGDLSYVLSMSGNNSQNSRITQDGHVYVGADETSKLITITATTNAKFGASEPKAVTGTATIKVKD